MIEKKILKNIYVRVRGTDLKNVAIGREEDLNQSSQSRRVDSVVVGHHDRGSLTIVNIHLQRLFKKTIILLGLAF